MIRYWSGDIARWDMVDCPCGRTYPTLVTGIYGRTDDMIIVRGQNVFPSHIEDVLRSMDEFGGEFRLVLERDRGRLDRLTVQAEVTADIYSTAEYDASAMTALREKMGGRLRQALGIGVAVELKPPGEFERTQFKSRRTIDLRPGHCTHRMTFTGFFILGAGIALIAASILPGLSRYLRGGAINSLRESPNYKYWGFIAIAIGLFASVVDHGSVNVALPTIAEHFHTDLPTVQWVIIGYALTISATLLPMGRVSDMLGRKEVYLFGSVIYLISAALVGSSQDFAFLILFRIMQGIGGAMTQGTGMAIIMQIFPPNERGRAVGLVMTIVGTGQVAGPAIGGGLVSWLGWRAVFFPECSLGAHRDSRHRHVAGLRAGVACGIGRSSGAPSTGPAQFCPPGPW